MRTQLRAFFNSMSPDPSTEGYSESVNSRQQHRPRLGRFTVGVGAALVALLTVGAAFADEPAKTKKANPQAAAQKLKAALKDAADELLPVPEESSDLKAQKGVVVLQRAGQVVGLGTILDGDGRILTALSPLGTGNDLEAKFADNSVQKVKIGHSNRIWDLALLVPQAGKWTKGLKASSVDPTKEGSAVKAFSAAKSKLAAMPIDLRGKRSLLGGDDQILKNALELGSKVSTKDLGSPLLDEDGRVVGILSRACLPVEGKACAPVAYGVPVSAIKSFLKTVPADAVQPTPWLGIQGESESTPVVKGVRVLSVAKNSPAADAKLKGGEKGVGDLIVAVAGEPVTSPAELAAAVKKRAIGEKVPVMLFSNGAYKQVDVVLRAPPEAAKPATSAPAEKREFATPPPEKKKVSKAARAQEESDDDELPPPPVEKKSAAPKPEKKKAKYTITVDRDPFNDPE